MGLEIDPITGIVSFIALMLSVFATYKSRQKDHYQEKRENYTNIETLFVQLEMKLADVPTALKFHGIDPSELESKGISVQEFSYVLANFTTASMDYRERDPEKIKEELTEYRIKMLKSESTRKVWPYIKKMMSSSLFTELVDKKIAEIEAETKSKQK